jgi:phage-related minor tail protein
MDDEEIESLVVRVRADTASFVRDVDTMRESLEGPLSAGVDRAGRAIETGLLRAVRTGKFGFEDLRRMALSVLAEIASAALRNGLDALGTIGRGGGGGGGLLTALAGAVGGLPGRATGGPVAPGVAYVVGERGPELFVPTSSGRIEAGGAAPRVQAAVPTLPVSPPPRDIRLTIAISAPAGEAPAALARSSRQVARAVRAALAEAG